MLRVSNYVIGAPIPGQPFHIMMHGFTGALDKMSAGIGATLLRRRGAPLDPSSPEIPAGERARLIARGYLTELTPAEETAIVVEVARTLHASALGTARPGFMFVPTYFCNLRCPYCFQPHTMHSGRGRFSAILQPAQVDQAFAVIDRLARPGGYARALGLLPEDDTPPEARGLDFGLFGGEPLCAQTRDVVAYILGKARERDCTLSAVTNGVDLHLFEDMLGPDRIRELQITLDGTAQLHNKRRIGPGLHNTFDTIIGNIDLALARGTQVSIRINTDTSNIDQLAELDRVFEKRGWKDDPRFSANAAAVTPEGVHEELVDRARLATTTMALRETQGSVITSYERYAQETLARCLGGEEYPFRQTVNCSSETGLVMFDPLGDIYSCWEDIGKTEFRAGVYDADGLHFLPEAARPWLQRFPGSIEQCSACPYALIHASGCAKHARERTGTLLASDCDHFQALFPATLADAYVQAETAILAAGRPPAAPKLQEATA